MITKRDPRSWSLRFNWLLPPFLSPANTARTDTIQYPCGSGSGRLTNYGSNPDSPDSDLTFLWLLKKYFAKYLVNHTFL